MQPGFIICRPYSHTDRRHMLEAISDMLPDMAAAEDALSRIDREDAFVAEVRAWSRFDQDPEEEERALQGAEALEAQPHRYATFSWGSKAPDKLKLETRAQLRLRDASQWADFITQDPASKGREVFVLRFSKDAPLSPGMMNVSVRKPVLDDSPEP